MIKNLNFRFELRDIKMNMAKRYFHPTFPQSPYLCLYLPSNSVWKNVPIS
jgi:hypothetical protein